MLTEDKRAIVLLFPYILQAGSHSLGFQDFWRPVWLLLWSQQRGTSMEMDSGMLGAVQAAWRSFRTLCAFPWSPLLAGLQSSTKSCYFSCWSLFWPWYLHIPAVSVSLTCQSLISLGSVFQKGEKKQEVVNWYSWEYPKRKIHGHADHVSGSDRIMHGSSVPEPEEKGKINATWRDLETTWSGEVSQH